MVHLSTNPQSFYRLFVAFMFHSNQTQDLKFSVTNSCHFIINFPLDRKSFHQMHYIISNFQFFAPVNFSTALQRHLCNFRILVLILHYWFTSLINFRCNIYKTSYEYIYMSEAYKNSFFTISCFQISCFMHRWDGFNWI
jgi:hypothetical protein